MRSLAELRVDGPPGLAHADESMASKLRLDGIAQHVLLRQAEPATKFMELLDPLVVEVEGYLTALYFSHAANITAWTDC